MPPPLYSEMKFYVLRKTVSLTYKINVVSFPQKHSTSRHLFFLYALIRPTFPLVSTHQGDKGEFLSEWYALILISY